MLYNKVKKSMKVNQIKTSAKNRLNQPENSTNRQLIEQGEYAPCALKIAHIWENAKDGWKLVILISQ